MKEKNAMQGISRKNVSICTIAIVLTQTFVATPFCRAQTESQSQVRETIEPETARDTLVMTDGKTVTGIIQEESESIVRMIVFAGTMRAETTFERKDIKMIKRGWVLAASPDQQTQQVSSSYVKPEDVVLTTPILIRASAKLSKPGPSPTAKGLADHKGEAKLVGYLSCPEALSDLYIPGKRLETGAMAHFDIEGVVPAVAKTTLKEEPRIQYLIARRAVDYVAAFDSMKLRLYGVHGGVLLEGRVCREKPKEAAASPGKCPPDQYERPMLIEWRKPSSPIGTNAIFLTLFGSRFRTLALECEAASARSTEEMDAVDDLLANGLPIGCSHCGGDGELTGADSGRFTREEAEDFQRRVSALAAGAGNGFTRSRVVVGCRECRGSGVAEYKKPSGDLKQRALEYRRIHERFAESSARNAKTLLAQVKGWEEHPGGNPDWATEDARSKLLEAELRRSLDDAPRSRELLDEIKRLLRKE